MPTIRLDQTELHAAEGMTILEAAAQAGIAIPTLCHLKGIEPQTSCLICVVRINGGKRLVPACATKVAEGMVIENSTPAVREARRTALELLLAEHAGECFAPCSQVCPAHLDIPEMVRQIKAGDLTTAIATARDALVLPAALGYVCPGLCEKGCRRGSADEAVSICALHRAIGEQDLAAPTHWLPERKAATGKRIAIIGAGPSGLAAAWELLKAGHLCTIIDAHELAGGTLRYGLEPGKLPGAVLDAEIALISALGAQWQLGVAVDEAALARLLDQFDAIALTSGPLPPKCPEHLFISASAANARQHAVQAVSDGKDLAAQITAFLAGAQRSKTRFAVRLGVLSEREMQLFMGSANPRPRIAQPDTLTSEQACDEAGRCMLCGCSSTDYCSLRRYAIEYDAQPSHYRGRRRTVRKIESHSDLVFEEGKCISCGLCVAIAKKAGEPIGLSFIARGFEITVAAPLGRDWSQALTHAAEEAAKACPTGAIHRRR